MQIIDGRLEEAEQLPCVNFTPRPCPEDIGLIVVHNISLPPGQFGGPYIRDFFLNRLDPRAHEYFTSICDLQVSAHLLIERSGQLLQFVPFDQRAWHAGVSCYQGRDNCNDFSIGIELEGSDDIPYSDEQYAKLSQVIDSLIAHYPRLDKQSLCGHSDIAPGRKTDPGEAFDWARLQGLLA